MKKTIITIILTLVILMVVGLVAIGINGYLSGKQPDLNKILTNEEIKTVLDDSILQLRGKNVEFTLINTDDEKGYSAVWAEGETKVSLVVWNISTWSQETLNLFTGKKNTTFETFVLDEYNKNKGELDEKLGMAEEFGIEPPRYTYDLQTVCDFDTSITFFPAGEGGDMDMRIAKTLIGKHEVSVSVEGNQPGLNLDPITKLDILVKNILKALSK